jgi:hypothetical protein
MLGVRLKKVEIMAHAFEIVSVDRTVTNWGHQHVTAVRTAPEPGSPDRWPITWVLGALAAGDLFYTINKAEGTAFARPYRCICGFATIRTTPSDEMGDGLESISMKAWQELSAPASC